jgi:hypothetical protein
MRSLIGIDAGMLNQNLSVRRFGAKLFAFHKRGRHGASINPGVNVSRPGDLKLLKSLNPSDSLNNLFRDFSRRFPQLLCQLKRKGQRKLAEFHLRRLLDDNPFGLDTVLATQKVAHVLGQPALQMSVQEFS